MSFEITCPYCFKKMKDTEVMFRSEKVNHNESNVLPNEYDDIDDFIARYRGSDKENILQEYRDWEFFAEATDPEYEAFWANYGGTTENNPADNVLRVKAYHRKVIDPGNPVHQRYLKQQTWGDYFIRDSQGMVAQIELNTGEKCNRRVCRHCHNPFPDNYGKHPVTFATVIGITGAGKTVYLSQLLCKMKTYAVKAGLSAIVNNTGVLDFLERNSIAANQPLPGSTPATRFQQPLFYEMVRDAREHGRVIETFVLYDVAGEVFTDSHLVNKFAPFVEHSDGVIVLIDPMQFEAISGVMSYGSKLSEPATVLDTIHGLICNEADGRKCDIPFAVCISKADIQAVQNVFSDKLKRMLLDDVRGIKDSSGFNLPLFNASDYNPILNELYSFIQNHELVLAQQMQTNYSSYAYFAFTALGCDVGESEGPNGDKYQYPVGPVLPKRVEEPLLWLFYKLGYIGVDTPIEDPTKPKICCPVCGGSDTWELPEGERFVTTGRWPFKSRVYVNRECSCGYRWEQE